MVQFNLLPDVKVEYMKTQKTKRLVILASLALTSLALFVLILLFMIVNVFQKQHISNLSKDIDSKVADLKAEEDLDKVITVQNQVNSLTKLHEAKPAGTRLSDMLFELTPNDAKISSAELDFAGAKISISGSAKSLSVINKYVDTIKFTKYEMTDPSQPDATANQQDEDLKNAFSSVVLDSYSIGNDNVSSQEGKTSYTISFIFDPLIFDNTKNIDLIVPKIISTRSYTEKPSELFEAKPKETKEEGN
jgi:hypothetical protein